MMNYKVHAREQALERLIVDAQIGKRSLNWSSRGPGLLGSLLVGTSFAKS